MKISYDSSKKDNLNTKLLICYNSSINAISENKNNKLLSSYSEIVSILKLNKNDLLYFIYKNRYNVNEILYDEEEYINIEIKEENRNLANYFSLDLLINDNKEMVNYIYPIQLIDNINKIKESFNYLNIKYLEKENIDNIYIDIIKTLFQPKHFFPSNLNYFLQVKYKKKTLLLGRLFLKVLPALYILFR